MMTPDDCGDITGLLKAWHTGDDAALNRLTPLIYDQLRRMARRHMRNERGNSLQTTALVHEAYLRLADAQKLEWNDRVHFFAVAAQMMRRILVSAARKRHSAKRGGDRRINHSTAINFDEIPKVDCGREAELIALDDALGDLAGIDIRKVRVVELRFFGGLTVDETAEALNISPQSVMRDWKLAKAWLKRELRINGGSS